MNTKTILYSKAFGIIVLIGYTVAILGSWAYKNMIGQTYFMLGEPNSYIKWFEWGIGLFGILMGIGMLKLSLDESKKVVYDPPV